MKALAIVLGTCILIPSFSFVHEWREFCSFLRRSSKTSQLLLLLEVILKHNIRFLLNEEISMRNEGKFMDSSILIINHFGTLPLKFSDWMWKFDSQKYEMVRQRISFFHNILNYILKWNAVSPHKQLATHQFHLASSLHR